MRAEVRQPVVQAGESGTVVVDLAHAVTSQEGERRPRSWPHRTPSRRPLAGSEVDDSTVRTAAACSGAPRSGPSALVGRITRVDDRTMGRRSTETEVTGARAGLGGAPVEVSRVVAFLDGSVFAERALPVAAWIAGELRVGLELVEVVGVRGDGDRAVRYLRGTADRRRASSWDVIVHEDVPAALAEVVRQRRGAVPCLATHGRDRSAALLGSIAAALLARSPRPVLLAGPKARPVEAPDAPVVVAVDGSAADEALLPVAMGWAARLGRRLVITTVAEPAPLGHHGRTGRRGARGPGDPESYLAALAERGVASRVEVATGVVHGAVGVRGGLVSALDRGRPSSFSAPTTARGWAASCGAAILPVRCTMRPYLPWSCRRRRSGRPRRPSLGSPCRRPTDPWQDQQVSPRSRLSRRWDGFGRAVSGRRR